MSSLYENIGGEKAVDAAVALFYEKIMADDRVNQFFDGKDMNQQKKMQKDFLTYAFGGPNNYNGRAMRAAHKAPAANGLNNGHFDAVMELLGATLTELGLPQEHITAAAEIAESVRSDVLQH